MCEIIKLNKMLFKAGIPHTFTTMEKKFFGENASRIHIYRDDSLQEELDDVIFHKFSHGYAQGLLETYHLSNCNGFETAEEVFEGWMKKYFS